MLNKLCYSPAEFAELCGLGRSTVHKRIAQGLLPAHRDGGRTVILSDDAQRYLDGLPAAVYRRKKPEK